jgi:hypothetical protein
MAERADILAREEVNRWRRDGVRPGLDVIRRTMEAAERGGFEHLWGTVYGHCLHALVRDHREVAEAAILAAMDRAEPRVHDGAARAFLYYHGLATPWFIADEVADREFDELPWALRCVRAFSKLDTQVVNGGFSQFYCNGWGCYAPVLIDFFEEIGAHASADLMRRTIEAFTRGREYGEEELIELLDGGQDDELSDALDVLDGVYAEDVDARYPRVVKFMYANRDVVGAFDAEGWERYI